MKDRSLGMKISFGFAVVADEVRILAMRAADLAKDTGELIEGTVNKVRRK